MLYIKNYLIEMNNICLRKKLELFDCSILLYPEPALAALFRASCARATTCVSTWLGELIRSEWTWNWI